MDIERMREFVEFSRTLNFTEAARALHMSQPNLSKHIREMEREVGADLVARGTMGAPNALTTAGTRFLDFCRSACVQYDVVVGECRDLAVAEEPVRIQDVRHVVNVTSQLRIRMKEAGVARADFAYVPADGPLGDGIDRGVADLELLFAADAGASAFWAEGRGRDYGLIPLQPEPLRVLAGEGNALFGRTSVALAELAPFNAMRGESAFFEETSRVIGAVFAAAGLPLTFRAYADKPINGGAYPMAPTDVNICTERFVQYYRDLDAEDFSVLTIEDFQPVLYPFLVYRRDNESPAVRRIVDALGCPGDSK